MGVYVVRNLVNGLALIGSSVNIPGMLNRQRFQLEMGGHANRALQKEWDALGASSFVFETLDTLSPPADPDYVPSEDLMMLEDMWLDRLSPASGEAHPLAPGGVARMSDKTRKSPPC